MKRLLIAGLIGLAGCTSTSVAANDPQPTNTDAKAIAAIRAVLKDPSSIQGLQLGNPTRATTNRIYPNAWNVCATFGARNSFGGMTRGAYRVFFKDNKVVDVKGGPDATIKADCGPLRAVSF
jgi:hypothetical protein